MDVVFQKDKNHKNSKVSNIKKVLKDTFYKKDSALYYYLFLLFVGLLFFITSLATHNFTTIFTGDYHGQELAFYTNGYDDWWHFFKTGEFVLYDTNTFLGASNIGANSFYYLFDPFFFLILLFPRVYIAQGMAIITILKIATGGLFFSLYMQTMKASKRAARVSGLAYAFSGWVSWFLWFNHMTEVMTIFPLILMGVEKVLRNKKPWLLMFSIFLMGVTNYFFFIAMTIAGFLYAMWRFFQRCKAYTLKENFAILGIGFVGFLAGCLMACCIVIPSAMVALNAQRSSQSSYLDNIKNAFEHYDLEAVFKYICSWDSLGYSYRTSYPFVSFFFPCASCRGLPLTKLNNDSYDNVATNIYCYMPFILLFIPALMRSFRTKKYSHLVAALLLFLMLLMPFFYYMFFGFTTPYGRWELFVVSSFITYVGLYLDHIKDEPLKNIGIGYIFTVIMYVLTGVITHSLVTNYGAFTLREDFLTPELATIIMVSYSTIVFILIVLFKNKKRLYWVATCFVTFEAVVMGCLTISGHGTHQWISSNNGLTYNLAQYDVAEQLKEKDPSYFRCWSYLENESSQNNGMLNDYNGLGMFHSLYNFNVNNLVSWVDIQGGNPYSSTGAWSGCYVCKQQDLDKVLGVKYYFIQSNSPQWGWMGENGSDYQYNVPFNFVDVTKEYPNKSFVVYQDSKFINFAMTYDTVYPYTTYEGSTQAKEVLNHHNHSMFQYENILRNEEMMVDGALLETSIKDKILESNPSITVKDIVYEQGLEGNQTKILFKSKLTGYTSKIYDLGENEHDAGGIPTSKTHPNVYSFFDSDKTRALTSDELLHLATTDGVSVATKTSRSSKGRYVTEINLENAKRINGTLTLDYWTTYDPLGYAFYILAPYYQHGWNIFNKEDIYLVDENDKIITWDRHQDDKYNHAYSQYRGFYIRPTYDENGVMIKEAPKIKRILIAHRELDTFTPTIYTETYSEYMNRFADKYNYQVSNVVYRTNKFSFDTNFASSRVVVTQIPYEEGWSITANGKEIEVFVANGGFVSFLSQEGQTHYEMEFYPAYLKEGKYLTSVGLLIFLTSFYGFYFFTIEANRINYFAGVKLGRKKRNWKEIIGINK